MNSDKFIQAAMIAVFCLFILTCLTTLEANAEPRKQGGTGCDEWASMVQVLVLRWQGQASFQRLDNEDVKAELKASMGSHPEIDTALNLVDYAYAHRQDNPVHVWKAVNFACESGTDL